MWGRGCRCVEKARNLSRISQYYRKISQNVDNSARLTLSPKELTEGDLKELVAILSPEQRVILHEQIKLSHSRDVKERAEEKLASWRWRSKFGRPASLVSNKFEADPTGTYCEIPVDWLQQKAAELSKPKPPNVTELRQLGIHNALPFIGFGFLDNLIMIVAGDYIDITIGTSLSISTMAAAALGNTVSDLAGIGSAWYVENIATKIGITAPELSQEQLDTVGARWCANMGRGLGVVIGCLLGMFPLLFLPDHSDDRKTSSDHRRAHLHNKNTPHQDTTQPDLQNTPVEENTTQSSVTANSS